ncbi:caspase family protein [Silvibacterium acidisoli]|uniref:caspase family protein n=1 Tax=Acidobacteriaceae bacterium ZG23-2 TaxID=2883246 RepID=UPI00406BE269
MEIILPSTMNRLAGCLLALSLLPCGLHAQTHKTTAKPAGKTASQPDNNQLTARGGARPTFTQSQQVSFEAETKEAILVAPNYRNSGLASLRFTYNDAAELKTELERQGYRVHLVPSTEATADGVRKALANEKTYLGDTTQGTLIFAFMGHGFEDKNEKNFLMTYGSDPDNMDTEALPLDEVQDLMKQSGARRNVIFIDACRASNSSTRDTDKPRSMASFKASEGMTILLATKPGSYSFEDPELSHGIFTYYLLEGLRGKAVGADGYITFGDLSKYVSDNVRDYAEKKEEAQLPRVDMHDVGGDFLIATAPAIKPEEIKPPSAATSLVTSDTPVFIAGTGQAYFVVLNGSSLTLLDAATGKPLALLSEDPSQIKTPDQDPAVKLQWFGGVGADGNTFHIVTRSKGSEIFQVRGRIGKPCPGGLVCNQITYPKLPGEATPQIASANQRAKDVGNAVGAIFKGRLGATGQKTAQTSTTLNNTNLATDPNNKFTWTIFDLVTTIKEPAQTANQAKKS